MDMLKSADDPFVVDSFDVIEFKLIRSVTDLEDDSYAFKPEMCHQVFGESESIFGYKDLKIKIYYSAAKLITYVGINYSQKVHPDDFDGIEADDILGKLSDKLQAGYHTNIDTFVKELATDNSFRPWGELLHSFSVTSAENNCRNYEIYCCDSTMPDFVSYHERLQTFILWYIDASSFIDVDDEKWRFFLLYEKYSDSENRMQYAIAGYATVYEYYAYPLSVRPRISQMLVLPPFQKQGLGTRLLNTIYKHYIAKPDVLDITVEDPSEEFQQVRDYADACNCSKLESFKPELLGQGFSPAMVAEARMVLKINKKQARRVYEILRLKNTNVNNDADYKSYRLAVKQRLNVPFQKQKALMKKLKPVLRPEEFDATMAVMKQEQYIDKLGSLYEEAEQHYRKVLKRMSLASID